MAVCAIRARFHTLGKIVETDPMIVGRQRELTLADAFLDAAATGFAVLDIDGEAGIGKTTVWREVLERAEARGFRVLACRPAAAEAKLSLAAISDLLAEVPEHAFGALSELQRRALERALRRADVGEAVADHRSVAVSIRSLLRALAAEQPVLLAVDDVQWLDSTSAATLEFALRRLQTEPLGVVASRRTGEPARLKVDDLVEPGALTRVTLGPLTVAGLHHVLRERLDEVPPRSMLVRIGAASHGNPLFALEIARLLAESGDAPPVGEPLPVPADVESLVRRRTERLPPGTREVLLASASLAHPREDVVRAALARSIVEDLEPAEREQIASLRRGVVTFAHPLFAAAVYTTATSAERRAMHRRLSQTVGDPEEHARHLALAADGRDEEAAVVAHAAAGEAAARGAPTAAAELVELALGLAEPGSEAEPQRVLDLATYLVVSGETARARALLERVDAWEAWPPIFHARALDLFLDALAGTDGPEAVEEFGMGALQQSLSPQARAAIHCSLSFNANFHDQALSLEHADAALALLEPLGEEADAGILAAAMAARIRVGLVLGHGLDRDLVERMLALEARASPSHPDNLGTVGVWLRRVGDLDASRDLLSRAVLQAVERGDEPLRSAALAHLAMTECLAGELEVAREHAAAALGLAQELEAGGLTQQAAVALALADAHLGNVEKVRALNVRGPATRPYGEAIVGLLELSSGDAEAADEHLRRSLELIEDAGVREPGIHLAHADAAEAAVAVGDLERAERIAAFLDEHGKRTAHPWSLATGARVQALVAAARGELEDALAACEQALLRHEALPMPLERARTLLTRGVIERRARKRGRAKKSFEEALEVFEASGARLWAERARAELGRVGLRRSSGNELTEGERSVARLSAQGLTRRQVAAALHLSPKTVDATLARVYRKLDIHSRAELGARMVELQK
jgi:DNA-binding CsgD family transcriptional regulator